MCVIYYDKTIIAVFSAVKYLYNKLKIIRFILILLQHYFVPHVTDFCIKGLLFSLTKWN